MKLYIITRNCCLGPCCSRGHKPHKQVRVQQLRTLNKENAERCYKSFDNAGYNAELSSIDVPNDMAEKEQHNYA